MADFFSNTVAAPAKAAIANVSAQTGVSSIFLYVLLVVFVIFVAMMLMNIKPSLSWLIPRKYVVSSAAYKFWAPSGVYSNLTIQSSESPLIADNIYTMLLEGMLFNTRNYQSTDGPYRHIAHRGSNELAPTTVTGAVGCSSAGVNMNLPPFGLPKRLNPGIFLDPNTNDILVFVDTQEGSNTYRESVRIADIPLDVPFSIGVIVNGKVLEVYLNCGLEATKLLSGTPRPVENVWYGLAGSAAANAQVQNLKLWDTPLPADDLRSVCILTAVKFGQVRPQCNGTANAVLSTAATTIQGAPSPQSDLGMSSQLNTCS